MANPGEARPVCVAAQFRYEVDQMWNRGAIEEAADATDETKGIEGITDTVESQYLDDGGIEFTPDWQTCDICKAVVTLDKTGDVRATRCRVTHSCELSWAEQHPETHLDEEGAVISPVIPCAGFEGCCRAILSLTVADDGLTVAVVSDECIVDTKGREWNNKREGILNGMKADDPGEDIEEFDGAGSRRDEAVTASVNQDQGIA